MSLLVLSSTDVDYVLADFPLLELQNLMARVFYLISASRQSPSVIDMPHRTTILMQNHAALFMPARVAHSHLRGTTLKVVSVPQKPSDTRGLPASTIVIDEETGIVKALVNARSLTAFRNAAGSLLSTNIVGLSPTSVVAFGAGKQIDAHLELHLRYFPTLILCTIVNRTLNERVAALAQRLRARFPNVVMTILAPREGHDVEVQLQAAVSAASLIICATSATTPLFPAAWVRTGTHVVLVGSYTPAMREVERALVLRAAATPSCLLVDSQEACAIEAGELIDAGLGPKQVREIGECIFFEAGNFRFGSVSEVSEAGSKEVTANDGPITMFKSVGVALQDVSIACAVVERAEKMKIGTRIPKYDV